MTNAPTSPTPRLVSIDRRQILLRTVDVEKLIDEDHSARSLWELVGRLDLRLYHAQIAAVEGHAGVLQPVHELAVGETVLAGAGTTEIGRSLGESVRLERVALGEGARIEIEHDRAVAQLRAQVKLEGLAGERAAGGEIGGGRAGEE